MFTKFSMLVVNADKVMGIGLKEWPSLVLITSPLASLSTQDQCTDIPYVTSVS